MSQTLRLNEAVNAGMKSVLREYGTQIVGELARRHNFDADAELRELNMLSPVINKKKEQVKKKGKKKEKASCVLPYCGEKREGNCEYLKMNHGLLTQCLNNAVSNGACTTCGKKEPTLGRIDDRLKCGAMEYEVNGKKPLNYGNVMEKLGISREEAEREADKLGMKIPEEQFEVKKGKRGRPKKVVVVVSDSDDAEPTKKRGRPKKEKKVVSSTGPGDDLISALIAQSDATAENEAKKLEETAEKEAEKPKKEKKEKKEKKPKKEKKEKKERRKRSQRRMRKRLLSLDWRLCRNWLMRRRKS